MYVCMYACMHAGILYYIVLDYTRLWYYKLQTAHDTPHTSHHTPHITYWTLPNAQYVCIRIHTPYLTAYIEYYVLGTINHTVNAAERFTLRISESTSHEVF